MNFENKELAARFMAVQAYYQAQYNTEPLSQTMNDFLVHGFQMQSPDNEDDIITLKPHGTLFRRILVSLNDNEQSVHEIMKANITKKEPVITKAVVKKEETAVAPDQNDSEDTLSNISEGDVEHTEAVIDKSPEPLLMAIICCALAEILVHQDIDKALIIDDYLNITHGFYEKNTVSFINGILDSASTVLREE